LDVSKNTLLTTLRCFKTSLTTLDVSNNTLLKTLYCYTSNLTALDVSNNTYLTTLYCYTNSITSLDVSNNLDLTVLLASNNDLTSLDVSNNTDLYKLNCSRNDLTTLDVSNNLTLSDLRCSKTDITILDLSNHSALSILDCSDTSLTSLNVANGANELIQTFYAVDNPNLTCVQVDDADYSSTYWTDIDTTTSFSTDCSATSDPIDEPIEYVYIPDTNFKTALVTDSTINTDGDTEISVTEAATFSTTLDIAGLEISDLTGIEAFINMKALRCKDNALTVLDLSHNSRLISLRCNNNNLVSLNVANGNNNNFIILKANDNVDLTCIQIDDDANETIESIADVDATASFGTYCDGVVNAKAATITIEKITFNNSIEVYPNPVRSIVNISLSTTDIFEKATVFNLLGEKITETNQQQIDMSDFSNGVYVVKIKSTTGKIALKKVLKR